VLILQINQFQAADATLQPSKLRVVGIIIVVSAIMAVQVVHHLVFVNPAKITII
jgi:hypothetical protein